MSGTYDDDDDLSVLQPATLLSVRWNVSLAIAKRALRQRSSAALGANLTGCAAGLSI